VSVPFNPTIARIFYLTGYVESWGRGIEKILTVCKNDGVPKPEFSVRPADIMLKFTVKEELTDADIQEILSSKVFYSFNYALRITNYALLLLFCGIII